MCVKSHKCTLSSSPSSPSGTIKAIYLSMHKHTICNSLLSLAIHFPVFPFTLHPSSSYFREFNFSVLPLLSPQCLSLSPGKCILSLSKQLHLSIIRGLECYATSQSTVSSCWRDAEGTLCRLTSK